MVARGAGSGLAALVLWASVLGCSEGPPGPKVVSVEDLGALVDASAPTLWRDGGSSVLLGGQVLWAFGDTIFPFRSADGVQLRTNTAALAWPGTPLAVSEPLDANGAPFQFVPFTAEEAAFNAASSDERIALWPGAMVPLEGDRALVVVDRLKVHSGALDYEELGTELALAGAGRTTATRLGALFSAPEPSFVHGAVAKDGLLYLYACTPGGPCRVARAPLETATLRSAYEFYTSAGWTPALARAEAVVPGSTAGFSVAWNEALGKFVAASTPGFSNALEFRTAPSPEGPFSEPTVAFEAPSAIYGVYLHPELSSGSTVAVSYSRQESDFSGEIRLLLVELR